MASADSESSPTSDPKPASKSLGWIIVGGIISILVGIGIGVFIVPLFAAKPKAAPPIQREAGLPLQTEAIFLKHFKTQPDEWLSARADHQMVAYAVFDCKKPSDVTIDTMPRHIFSALLLDLTPSGNHVFEIETKDGDDVVMAARNEDTKPFLLTPADRELLSFSDSIARARLAAADGANSIAPLAGRLGFATLIVTALATLFVTLQARMKSVDEPPSYQELNLFWRVIHKLFGLGAGFRWVAFFAITLSIAGTSLTGLKQVFDPARTLTQNTRAVLDLRQLHQELTFGIKCGDGVTASNINPEWFRTMRQIRGTILPNYGAYANFAVGSLSPPQAMQPSDSGSRSSLESTPTPPPTPRTPAPTTK